MDYECKSCGQPFSSETGTNSCPACGEPHEPGGVSRLSEMTLKRESSLLGKTKRCPSCDQEAIHDAVLCVGCGYDWREGAHIQVTRSSPRKVFNALMMVMGLIITAGLIKSFLLTSEPTAERIEAENAAVNTTEEPVANPFESASSLPPEAVGLNDEAEKSLEDPETSTEVSDDPEPEQPKMTDEEEADFIQMRVRRLTLELDHEFPMYRSGEKVGLKKTSGIIVRGALRNFGSTSITLETDSAVQEILFEELDRSSRVRVDSTFRNRLAEFKARKKLQELKRSMRKNAETQL